jgi:hypothetical protein
MLCFSRLPFSIEQSCSLDSSYYILHSMKKIHSLPVDLTGNHASYPVYSQTIADAVTLECEFPKHGN